MNDIEKEIATYYLTSTKAVREAAAELTENVKSQVRRSFNLKTNRFLTQVKQWDYEFASIVYISRYLSIFVEPTKIKGNPNLWILLPTGEQLGFKRLSDKYTWRDLSRKWGSRLFFAGNVLIFRNPKDGKNYPVYALATEVTTTKKINFYEEAERIANERFINFDS